MSSALTRLATTELQLILHLRRARRLGTSLRCRHRMPGRFGGSHKLHSCRLFLPAALQQGGATSSWFLLYHSSDETSL